MLETRTCKWCSTGCRSSNGAPHICEDCLGTMKEYLCPVCGKWKNALSMDLEKEICRDCQDEQLDATEQDYFALACSLMSIQGEVCKTRKILNVMAEKHKQNKKGE